MYALVPVTGLCITSCWWMLFLQGAPNAPPYDIDLHMAALDLLAGMADALRASLDPLVAAAGAQLPQMILESCRDSNADVRQSAFALVGDMAKACPRYVVLYICSHCQPAMLLQQGQCGMAF